MKSTNKNIKNSVVLIPGAFNIIHPGHIRLINFAKTFGDSIVIGLFRDDHSGAFVDFDHRKSALTSLSAVKEVIEIRTSVVDLIHELKPQFVLMGKEHEFSSDAEQAALEYYGGKLIFGSGETKFSSRDLIKAELMGSESPHITITEKFLAQHKTQASQLIKRVQLFNRVNVLVLGELIVDEYIYCDPIGMSQEDPTIVVSPISRELFTGGAGIVAAHLSGLGANVTFTTVTGDDEFSESQETNLEAYGVNCQFISDETRPTILKQRYRTKEKTLLRVNHLASHDISRSIRRGIISRIEKTIKQFDLVVFSDFNYGVLPQPLVDQIINACEQAGIPFVADSQASSQMSNIGRFKNALLLSATEREARMAVSEYKAGIQNVSDLLLKQARAQNLIIKLGAEGLILLTGNPHKTDSMPALNRSPVDVAGAGDALLAAASLGLATGLNLQGASLLGSIAAALQVSRIGNTPLTSHDLLANLTAIK